MTQRSLKLSLLLLRLSVFLVFFVWSLDKFVRPEHAAQVFTHFYFFDSLNAQASYVLGALQMLLSFAFVFGFKKKFTYSLVLILHMISTLSSYRVYINPWEGPAILFFAAWPMLAACAALYFLRAEDTIMTVS